MQAEKKYNYLSRLQKNDVAKLVKPLCTKDGYLKIEPEHLVNISSPHRSMFQVGNFWTDRLAATLCTALLGYLVTPGNVQGVRREEGYLFSDSPKAQQLDFEYTDLRRKVDELYEWATTKGMPPRDK